MKSRSFMLIVMCCLSLWQTPAPAQDTLSSDTPICLPVSVIDQVILDLQELDYLRDITVADSAIIHAQSFQIDIMNRALSERDSLIEIENDRSQHYEGRIDELDKERKWWKWGGIGVATLLLLGLIIQ